MKPSALLDESKIILNIASDTPKADAISRLVSVAVDGEADSKPIIDDLLAREAKMTTGIGQGIAIPHARSPVLTRAVAALGVSPGGIDFEAVDGEPVNIVFTFVTPTSDPSLHIQTLAATAGLFADSEVREAVRRASSAAEVLEVIRSHNG